MAYLGFVGTGTITAAIVRGLKQSALRDAEILLSPRNEALAKDLARLPAVQIASDNQDVVDRAELLCLAVRPQIAAEVVQSLRPRPGQRIISLIAGLDRKTIATWMNTDPDLVCRAIPLPFVADGNDATPVFPPHREAMTLFSALGHAIPVQSQQEFDLLAALSALMGSYFGLVETASAWAEAQGLPKSSTRQYLGKLFANLGGVLCQDPSDLSDLRQAHSTAGGLNEQVWTDFVAAQGDQILVGALDRVLKRIQAKV